MTTHDLIPLSPPPAWGPIGLVITAPTPQPHPGTLLLASLPAVPTSLMQSAPIPTMFHRITHLVRE